MAAQQWTTARIPALDGKKVLITGANSGIGYQAALELARHGAHLILACRSAKKGQDAVQSIQAEIPRATVELMLLDVSSLADVHRFAAEFLKRGAALDILVNNAGVMALNPRQVTPEGFERQLVTNHLGHFALTGLLLPSIMAAPAPRVITVASIAHRNGKINFDDLQSERSYSPMGAYGQTKLANILFARELARRAVGSHLISLPVHPGVAVTQIFANGPGATGARAVVFKLLSALIMQSDAAGALPTLYAATSPDARSGDYIGPDGFMEMKGSPVVVQPRPNALDEAVAQRLWSVSEQLTGVTYPPLT